MGSMRPLGVGAMRRDHQRSGATSLFERFRRDLQRTSPPPDAFLRFVIGYKIVGGLLLLLLAGALVGFWRNQDMFDDLRVVLMESNLAANNRFLRGIADWAGVLTGSRALGLGFIALGYGVLELVEAGGLWSRRRWAEYLTALATALFLPVELREIIVHPTPLRVATFLLNLALVVYLVRAKHLFVGEPGSEPDAMAPDQALVGAE